MEIKLKYFTRSLQEKTGGVVEVLEVGEVSFSVGDVIKVLEEMYEKNLRADIAKPDTTILLNGENVRYKEGIRTPIKKKSNELVFLRAPGGG